MIHRSTSSSPTTPASPTATTFDALGLEPRILAALARQQYTTPTPIQAQAIGPAMNGRDILGCAQTGTGKTAAFALPILHRLLAQPRPANGQRILPRVLVLSPTRELATQIADSFRDYGAQTGMTHTTIFGGVSQHHQVKALQRGVDIIVATPGRLMDLMEQGHVNLSAIGVFVLDEADRMLDMGFIQPIRRIAAALPRDASKPRQTLLFSATMPREITHLAESLLRDPVRVAVTPVASAAPLIEQSVYMVPKMKKQALLEHVLAGETVTRALVFTKTKHGADKVMKRLHVAGVTAQAIHGNKAQNQRQRALDSFRAGRSRVLVATDVAARGLDVDGISHVINFDLPMEPEAYVHRIGRTGRAGATGIAISFCDVEERFLLRSIERLTGKQVPLIRDLPELKFTPPAPIPAGQSHHEHAERDGGPRPHGHGRPHRAGPKPQHGQHSQRGPRRDAKDGRPHGKPHSTAHQHGGQAHDSAAQGQHHRANQGGHGQGHKAGVGSSTHQSRSVYAKWGRKRSGSGR